MKERYIFIDILKGISIILVAYGHILPGAIPIFTEYAGIFRMPLFFFVSGVLFKDSIYKEDFKDFIYRRYRGLIIPFIYFSFLVALGYIFIEEDYINFLKNLLQNGWGGYALWFIPVLFGSQLLYWPLCLLSKWMRLMLIILLGILSFASSKLFGFVPYNLLLCFCGAYFFGLGNSCKVLLHLTKKIQVGTSIPLFVLGFIISLSYLLSNSQPQWFINDIPSLVFYIAPLGSILCLSILSIYIERYGPYFLTKFFSICGKQSYIILAFHQIIVMIAGQYLPSKLTIIIMFFTLTFLVWFIPKYLPWMLGKSYTK